MIFKDRQEAGAMLADKLTLYKNKPNTLIIGLPRGGVIVADQIARKLNLPLDIIVTRKIGAKFNPELAIGAITQNGQVILDENIIKMTNSDQKYIEQEINKEQKEALRRLSLYRGKRQNPKFKNKTLIIVDDGIATGNTIKAAIKYAKTKNCKKIILAIPVGFKKIIEELKKEVNEIICLDTPENFWGIGEFYKNFEQTTDEQVINIMKEQK